MNKKNNSEVKKKRTGRPYRQLGYKWLRAFDSRVNQRVGVLNTDISNLARKHNVSRKTFYCCGSAPSVERLLLLADILECSTDYLLGREELNDDKRRE